MTLEDRVLGALDRHEGTESFTVLFIAGPGDLRAVRRALQRLRRKGLVEPARCPDGAWVWFQTDAGERRVEGRSL